MLSTTADALHAHLHRLLAAGIASAVVPGLILLFKKPTWRDFGVMTAAWGVIDAIIALASGRGEPPTGDLISTIAFNEGLDAGYVGVGLAMVLLAGERGRIKAFGLAIVVQGAILLALDGKLWMDLARITLDK